MKQERIEKNEKLSIKEDEQTEEFKIIEDLKAKITKEMIVDTAFEIVRKEGADKVTARSISEQLNCSTQPVLYYFSTVEDIKKAVYIKADEYHSAYLLDVGMTCENPMLAIGINYIKFAIEERNLFRFLFQFCPRMAL